MDEQSPQAMTTPRQRIVFFDGECGFCNITVSKLVKRDRHRLLRYAPLQGSTAKELLPPELRNAQNLGTMVYIDSEDRRHAKSDAALAISSELGWPYRLMNACKILPLSLRNKCYDMVAKRRHMLAAKTSCSIPTPEEATLYLP